ncbi:MAG: 50S ribosomal protein L23 [Eubacteriales bacterium]
MNAHDIIRKPIMTERSYDNMEEKKYTFEVDRKANKTQIKQAVEEVFGVEVEKVNTITRKGKKKRLGKYEGYRSNKKLAIVKLTEGSKGIEFFESMG